MCTHCLSLQVVYFASETFHYHKADRMRIKMRKFATEQWPDTIGKKVSSGLPLKVSQLMLVISMIKFTSQH